MPVKSLTSGKKKIITKRKNARIISIEPELIENFICRTANLRELVSYRHHLLEARSKGQRFFAPTEYTIMSIPENGLSEYCQDFDERANKVGTELEEYFDSLEIEFTDCQKRVKFLAEEFLADPSQRYAVISGYAGTGKTFLSEYLIKKYIYDSIASGNSKTILPEQVSSLNSGRIIFPESIQGLASTHVAKNVLMKATSGFFGDYATTASFLSLIPKVAEITPGEVEELDALIAKDELSEVEKIRLESLEKLKEDAHKQVVTFAPSRELDEIVNNTRAVKLILIDEGSMVSADQFSLINNYVMARGQDVKLIYMGDPFQLPPIGESMSKVFTDIQNNWAPMKHVKRYSGPILEYATGIRNGENVNTYHYTIFNKIEKHYPGQEDSFFFYNDDKELYDDAAEIIKEGEDVRFLSSINAVVDEINWQIRSRTQEGEKFYQPGDILLTTAPIARDSYGKPRPSPKGTTEIFVNTSTRIIVDSIDDVDIWKNPFTGTEYKLVRASISDFETQEPIGTKAILVDLEMSETWTEEEQLLRRLYDSTYSSSNNPKYSRGQIGKKAAEAWRMLGIRDWFFHTDGTAITEDEHKRNVRRIQIAYWNIRQLADPCKLAHASTVHRAQGDGFDTLVMHMRSLLKQYGDRETWSVNRIVYTAATRARKQLIFMV